MATITRSTKSAATITRSPKTLVGTILATTGLYRGFGAFTYIGGETLVAGSTISITHQTKS